MKPDQVSIKGTSNGLVVTLGKEGELDTLLSELTGRLAATGAFFKGGRVAVEVGERRLNAGDIRTIQTLLDRSEVNLWAVISNNEHTLAAAERLGLETRLHTPTPTAPSPVAADESSQGVLLRQTLRSGQTVHHPGHVVIIGDVNPGAEIVAGGDVVIWGRLRGVVHAGAMGDDEAMVCALSLAPPQLRIGHHIARSPEGKKNHSPNQPETASVQGGKIVVEAWKSETRSPWAQILDSLTGRGGDR